MTAEPDADVPMSPEEAVGVLKRRTASLRDAAQILQRPSAAADEHAVASALKVRKIALEAVEATQPIARFLVESLKGRAERVQELQDEIIRLRRLSDDVNATPAEAGTAHRAANSLQAERDDLAETLVAAHSAASAFEEARTELMRAQDPFSARHENAKTVTPSQAAAGNSRAPFAIGLSVLGVVVARVVGRLMFARADGWELTAGILLIVVFLVAAAGACVFIWRIGGGLVRRIDRALPDRQRDRREEVDLAHYKGR